MPSELNEQLGAYLTDELVSKRTWTYQLIGRRGVFGVPLKVVISRLVNPVGTLFK